jgi:Flp pilus assembly protein TadB/energy-coupling factor transporter ATP-binding protein EcfA2
MTHDQLRDTYSHRITQFQTAAKHHARLMNYIAFFRLASLIVMVWLIVLAVKNNQPLYHGVAAILVVGFLFLVSRYNKQKDLRNLNIRIMEANQRELACLEHRFNTLPDGMVYADPSHPWSHDLDLFGKGSLFQYLNRTVTLKGSALLAGILTTEPESPEVITERQGIILSLRDEIDFRQIFTARGSLVKEKDDDLPGILRWLSASAYIVQHRWLFFLAMGISLAATGIIVAGILNPGVFRYLLPLLLFNYTLLSPFLMRTNRYQETISKKHELLEGYARLLEIITSNGFDHPVLQGNREKAREGMKEVVKLSRLLGFFDQRLNMLLGILLNGLFLFDFIMMHLLESWKKRNSEKITEWIEITGWTDAMISLSGFAYNHPDFVMPEMKMEIKSMELHDLGHPLIAPGKRVVNHLTIGDEKIVIITGANMAGKSTFLRSLGVNTILAYAGCPVCASRFKTPFMGLCSSMRTADSLADEESYFLAEIKKLQRIVRRMEAGYPLLILLDEVLKGTNTTDKRRGSVGLIKRSLPHSIRCFIATHDLSLGQLEKELPGQVVNYCFESYIKELELEFDYTIRKGIATNMNASFLMKKMGIMD